LEDLPHGVSRGVFLFPDVTDERLGHDSRTGRHAAVVQIDDSARDAERVLDSRPVIFASSSFFWREMRNGFRRCLNISQQRSDRCRRKRSKTEALAGERNEVPTSAHVRTEV